jgi:hypothetical protein
MQGNEWVPASELAKREFNNMRGKICSAVESLGLPHAQERAVVTTIKQFTYDSQETIAQLLDEDSERKYRYNEHRIESQ